MTEDGSAPQEKAKAAELECLYNEYVRISERVDEHARGSFEDFKLLGVIGVLLGWAPLSESFGTNRRVQLFGCVALLLIVVILALRDLLKQSVVRFYIRELWEYETQLRSILPNVGPGFQTAERMGRWLKDKHRPLQKRFVGFFAAVLVLGPAAFLFWGGAAPASHEQPASNSPSFASVAPAETGEGPSASPADFAPTTAAALYVAVAAVSAAFFYLSVRKFDRLTQFKDPNPAPGT